MKFHSNPGACLLPLTGALREINPNRMHRQQSVVAVGTMAHDHLQEWLTFIGTQIHKQFSSLFDPTVPEEAKAHLRQKGLDGLAYADRHLAGADHLLGRLTVADGYLYAMTRWAARLQLDISHLSQLDAFISRMDARSGRTLAKSPPAV